MRDERQVQLRSGYPPRAETPFAFQGRYPGLRTGRAAFPWGFRLLQTAGVAHSGIVARPYSRLPLRGQHRNKVTTRFRQRFDSRSPSYQGYRRRNSAVFAVRVVTRTCFPLNPPGGTGRGTRELRRF